LDQSLLPTTAMPGAGAVRRRRRSLTRSEGSDQSAA
jgi:hypothetical protein